MASYAVNDAAVAKARSLIRGRHYVLDSDWGDVQPKAKDENTFLAVTFVERVRRVASRPHRGRFGRDEGALRVRVRRPPPPAPQRLIACHYRAAEWRHKEIELAAHELLQLLDKASA